MRVWYINKPLTDKYRRVECAHNPNRGTGRGGRILVNELITAGFHPNEVSPNMRGIGSFKPYEVEGFPPIIIQGSTNYRQLIEISQTNTYGDGGVRPLQIDYDGGLREDVESIDIPEITDENRDKLFPVMYGVELEYELDDYVPYNTIYSKIMESGVENCDVKSDGSLSEYGFEVISQPMESLEELNEFMDNVLESVEELGATNHSPTAIHIHVSNIKNPESLFYLMERYKTVFEHIKRKNNSGLCHIFLNKPKPNRIKEYMSQIPTEYTSFNTGTLDYFIRQKIDPILDKKYATLSNWFMDGRRCTLRYAGYDSDRHTLEFRVFPQRMDKNINRIYCQIVEKLIEMSDKVGYYDVAQKPTKELMWLVEEFKEVCELSRMDMYRLFHRHTTPSRTNIRSDMMFWEIINVDEPLTHIQLHGDNFMVGDLLTYKILEYLDDNTVNIGFYRNGIETDRTDLYLGPEDMGMIKWMFVGGVVGTLNPLQAIDDIVFYIPKAMVAHRSRGSNTIHVRDHYNNDYTYESIGLSDSQMEELENIWNKATTPETMGVDTNNRQWRQITNPQRTLNNNGYVFYDGQSVSVEPGSHETSLNGIAERGVITDESLSRWERQYIQELLE